MPTRRQFLTTGIAGAAALAAAKVAYDRWGREPVPAGAPSAARGDARDVVAAIVPVLLAGALPDDAEAMRAARDATTAAVMDAIAGLPPAVQAELDELFALLAFPPTRVLVAGLRTSWREATPADVRAFLDRFRDSRFALLQSAYQALKQLVVAAWYAQPASWPALGYDGPPRISG
jgi:hypothetical protein